MVAILIALALTFSGCKTSNPQRDMSSVRSDDPSEIQLTEAQNIIIAQYLVQMTAHVLRFDGDSSLRSRLESAMQTCATNKEGLAAATASSSSYAFQAIAPCPAADRKTVRESLQYLQGLKKSPAFETAITQMLDDVLPSVFDQLFAKMSAEGTPGIDAATSDLYLNTLNALAIRAEKLVQRFTWRPGYLIASRYLHQVVLTELGRANGAEVDWSLLKETVDLHMSVSPYAAGDLGVNPLVVLPSSPLYATLYGPTPRGAAYWLMKAAVSLRLEALDRKSLSADFGDFNEHQDLKTVLEQIALETPEDQALIKRGVGYLSDKAFDFTH